MTPEHPTCPSCGQPFEYAYVIQDGEIIAAMPDCGNPDCETNKETDK